MWLYQAGETSGSERAAGRDGETDLVAPRRANGAVRSVSWGEKRCRQAPRISAVVAKVQSSA